MYGEGQPKSSLLPQLKEAVARGELAFNMSGGEQLRDYMPVMEVAAILVDLALRQTDAGMVNVCSGKSVSVRNLVEGWLKDNGWAIKLNLGHYEYPDYEPMVFWGDNEKLKKILRNKNESTD
jgi:dTDP-6-deoxy-L-talose 4-dehydrogenase (NAD+)